MKISNFYLIIIFILVIFILSQLYYYFYDYIFYNKLSSNNLIFYDIHDGDYKLIKIKNYKYTILPYKNNQKWIITGNLNQKLEGIIDFKVKGKPKPPPVNLLLKIKKINNKNIIILFFDPSGTISPKNQPVNIWYNI
tara:strand:+ start:314 stop:724 length:411 start_codon:yes stop_codon:yes gene_type:complete